MPTEAEQKKIDEMYAGNVASGATFYSDPTQNRSALADIFRNVYGQDPSAQELETLLPQATGLQADFIKKLPTFESGLASLQFISPLQSGQTRPSQGALEQQSIAERTGIPTTGTGQNAYSYWDASRGVEVLAPEGQHFELYSGGGVKVVSGLIPRKTAQGTLTKAGAPATSTFTQATQGAPGGGTMATPGFKQESLAYQPAEGKTIVRTGSTYFDPERGIDVAAPEGQVAIEYTDGTVEFRPYGGQPGQAQGKGAYGPSAQELGITRSTEIKGEQGQITRAPMSTAEALAAAKTPAEADAIITGDGGVSTKELQLIGKTYRGKTAKDGNVFYVDPKTQTILERPESVQSLAQPLTIKGVAGTKIDVVDKFRAVFGREPNAEELKYWMGRTDKVGGALVGAMQFAKQSGAAVGGKPAAVADPVEAMKVAANTGQEKLANMFTEAGITPRSDDRKALRAQIEFPKAPTSGSLTEFTKEQLASTQFQEAQNNLNQAKNSLRQLDADYASNIVAAERTPGLSMGAIRRNQNELDIAYQRTRRDLTVELNAYSDIVQSQTAIMGLMIDAFKFDQQTAQQEYTNKFNQAMAMYNIMSQERQFEMQEKQFAYDVQKDLRDTQRANLTVITSMLQSGNLKYSNLSADQKAQIQHMEQALGLPAGFTSFIGKVVENPVVSFGTAYTDAKGVRRQPVYTVDPVTGKFTTTEITLAGRDKPAGSGSGSATSVEDKEINKFRADAASLIEKLDAGDIKWSTAWDSLHLMYPQASVATIDNTLGLSRRNN
jgi:hypothetical protein